MTTYLDTQFKGSIAESTTNSSTYEQLIYRKKYLLIAIDTHTHEGNDSQVTFFTENINLVNKILSKTK